MRRVSAALLVLLCAMPALAQERRGEHWVATWATALVARPQPGQGRAAGPGGPGAPPAGPGAAPPAATAAAGALPPGATPGGAAGSPPAGGPPAGPAGPGRGAFLPPANVMNQTVRQIVHTSIGGNRVRVVLSNVFGTSPIEIGGASVALHDTGAAIVPGSSKPLLFSGAAAATVLPGAILLSDPVDMAVAPTSDLVVDLFVPGDLGVGPSPVTTHTAASQTNYISTTGNHVAEPMLNGTTSTGAWFLIARVEVTAPSSTLAVVTFGDSITDGTRSTPDMNNRWPDVLARRLATRKGTGVAVLNAGIAGNRVLGDGAGVSALARFDRDVLTQTGITHVVVMEGINDIGLGRSNPAPSAADLIAGQKQLIERAHARGLKIYGATLTPFDGAAYFTPEGEAKRKAVNDWIRTGKAYDGVIDFDMVTRDPAAPTKFLPIYDSGDHLHPNDAGYKAMGEAVDLALFK